jgi:hypothetical protein
MAELLPVFRRMVVPIAVSRSPSDTTSYPRKYIPLIYTDIKISELAYPGN